MLSMRVFPKLVTFSGPSNKDYSRWGGGSAQGCYLGKLPYSNCIVSLRFSMLHTYVYVYGFIHIDLYRHVYIHIYIYTDIFIQKP